jgi:Flp pilus assembly protein TadG
MAMVLPLLLLLVCGIIDFGRLLNAQLSVSAAAREGARWAAMGQSGAPARAALAAPNLTPAPSTTVTAACPATPAINQNATVVVSYPFTFATPIGAVAGLFGGSMPGTVTITAQGVMRCGG